MTQSPSSAPTAAGDSSVTKVRTASLSVASNSGLILLKVIGGTITGSVALLTEAVHSSIDLVASVVAFFSVRKAGEPADESHRYGHERFENLAAAIEGILILVGSAVIAFEAVRRLLGHGQVHMVGLGIAVVAVSIVVNLVVSAVISRKAKSTDSAALFGDAAHLRTDALTSAGVLLALVLIKLTGEQWIDPVMALAVATVIVITGVRLLLRSSRVLVDEALPHEEVAAIRESIEEFAARGVVGYHELRTRRAGARRYVDMHVQFRAGTSLEQAHRTAHQLQDLIGKRLKGADVLIHLEPQDRVRPGEEVSLSEEGDAGSRGGGGASEESSGRASAAEAAAGSEAGASGGSGAGAAGAGASGAGASGAGASGPGDGATGPGATSHPAANGSGRRPAHGNPA